MSNRRANAHIYLVIPLVTLYSIIIILLYLKVGTHYLMLSEGNQRRRKLDVH